MSEDKRDKKPSASAIEKTNVHFSTTDSGETKIGKVVAFSLKASAELLSQVAPQTPPGVEKLALPEAVTLMSINLGSRPRRRVLLLDATEMKQPGIHQAERRVQTAQLPTLFYSDGANVYTCAEGSRIKLGRSGPGLQVAIDRCKMVPLNLVLDKRAFARKGDAPGALPISLAMESPIAPRARQVSLPRVRGKLDALGLGRRGGEQAAVGARVSSRRGDPLYCAWLLWRVSVVTHEAHSLFGQWWNPFAIWAAWAKLAEAAHLARVYASQCG